MRIPQPILDPRIIYTATRSTLVEAIKNQIFTITLPAFGHLTGNVKSEIVAQYMRMAYDDVKKNTSRDIFYKYVGVCIRK